MASFRLAASQVSALRLTKASASGAFGLVLPIPCEKRFARLLLLQAAGGSTARANVREHVDVSGAVATAHSVRTIPNVIGLCKGKTPNAQDSELSKHQSFGICYL